MTMAAPGDAQERFRVSSEASFRRSADGVVLGYLPRGAEITARRSSGNWIEFRLEGWIYTPSTSRTSREGFDLSVTPTRENLRAEPNGAIIARVVSGALLNRLEERGAWSRVRREVWVARSALRPAGEAVAARPSPERDRRDSTAVGAGVAERAGADYVEAAAATPLLVTPGGDTLGSLATAGRARVLSRSNAWVRVQVEAWVRESDLRPAGDSGVLTGVSAAEVRSAPGRFVGKVVEWRLQFLSVQKADELRSEIPEGRHYLLTRGPLPETGFVYVIIPPARVEQFQALAPLEEITVRATLRSATTRYLPNPVLELISLKGE